MSAPLTLSEVPAPRWEAVRATLPHSTAFHRHDFLTLVARALGCRLVTLGDPDGRALVPLLLRRRGPWVTVNWVPFPYLGPLAAPGQWPATLRALDAHLKPMRIGTVQLGLVRADPQARTALASDGWELTDDLTLTIPTAGRTAEELLGAMHANTRRRIRLGLREGLSAQPARREEITEALPRFSSGAFARQGKTSDYPAQRTAALVWEQLSGESAGGWRAMAIRDGEGTARAIGIMIEDRGIHYLWWGAAERGGRLDFHAIAYWDALNHAVSVGAQAVDLVGAPTPSITQYKERYGAGRQATLVARQNRSRAYLVSRATHDRLLRRVSDATA